MKRVGIILLLTAVVIAGIGFYRTFTPPKDLWTVTHQFSGCPSRPSCVSSVAKDDKHAIAPLRYDGPADQAEATLLMVVAAMPGAHIEYQDANYIHAIFMTPTMRFHDDVELLIHDSVVDVRSISRFGYGDHGVNRKRVEEIRARFDTAKGH